MVQVCSAHATKPNIRAPLFRTCIASLRTGQELRHVSPGSAAQHPVPAISRPGRVLGRRLAVVVLLIEIRHPFPRVARHVAQPETVLGIAADCLGPLYRVIVCFARIGVVVAPRTSCRFQVSATSAFPLGLGLGLAAGGSRSDLRCGLMGLSRRPDPRHVVRSTLPTPSRFKPTAGRSTGCDVWTPRSFERQQAP